MLKFRKMVEGATGHALTGDVDPRFTRIGRLLARTKLDELPQLWNVLRGQMSLVGPRPEDAGFVELHESEYREILTVRPGITGLGQLAFAKEAEILDPGDMVGHYVDRILPQKVHLDLLYARTRTLRGDLRILVWTVLARHPACERGRQSPHGRAHSASTRARRHLCLNPKALMTDNRGMPDLDAALEAELLRLTHRTPEADPSPRDTPVVIFAGGRGRRLEPYTSVLPKPLMPIGNRSILEIVVTQLADAGFRNLNFCVGYLSHLIRAVFDNGPGERVNINWVKEAEPLGTAGPLRLVEGLSSTFLAMNGDLLTTLDLGALLDHHRSSGNVLTIATHRRSVQSDYGVLHLGGGDDGNRVFGYEEKPEMTWNVSMGIYAMEPSVLAEVPPEGPFDFPELVMALLDKGLPVGAYVHEGLWLDIGRHEDYENAVELWAHGARLADAELLGQDAS